MMEKIQMIKEVRELLQAYALQAQPEMSLLKVSKDIVEKVLSMSAPDAFTGLGCYKKPGTPGHTVVIRKWEEHYDGKISPPTETRHAVDGTKDSYNLVGLTNIQLGNIYDSLLDHNCGKEIRETINNHIIL